MTARVSVRPPVSQASRSTKTRVIARRPCADARPILSHIRQSQRKPDSGAGRPHSDGHDLAPEGQADRGRNRRLARRLGSVAVSVGLCDDVQRASGSPERTCSAFAGGSSESRAAMCRDRPKRPLSTGSAANAIAEWVASGVSITRTISSSTRDGKTSNCRRPRPNSTGIWARRSGPRDDDLCSDRPAPRYAVPPAPRR